MVKILGIKKEKGLEGKLKIVWPLLALLVIGAILYLERTGIVYDQTKQIQNAVAADTGEVQRTAAEPVTEPPSCLIVTDENNEVSRTFLEELELVLSDMRVSYHVVQLQELEQTLTEDYRVMILNITDLSLLGNGIQRMTAWVAAGGTMMNTAAFDANAALQIAAGKMGILEGGEAYADISGLEVADGFMVGSDGRKFPFEEPVASNLEVLLKESCTVYVRGIDNGLPLLWETAYGKGKFVITNQTLTGKAGRGFLAAAYSLTEAAVVYPVINASAFYLDDFPAPTPSGDGTYIRKEFGMDISNFYANVWWEDILKWEEKYGILHTGLVVENYSDTVKAPFERTSSTERFTFYGNMLLNNDGELGFHGYNHMPLCLDNFNYYGLYDSYEKWESQEDMQGSLQELQEFSSGLFPEEKFQVYVPPSNILSEEGRQGLLKACPDLKAIASTYLPGKCQYTQEFEISPDGIAQTPRITSGTVMDDYTYLIAFSELNFHYVQSHFMHPDDVLDEDRGAELGWGKMRENFEGYLDWIYTAAPNIRDVTGSSMADAVGEYDRLSVKRTRTEQGLKIALGGFTGKASLMLRLNEGEIAAVTGASCEQVAEDLYLLEADSPEITVNFSTKGKEE